MAGFSTSQMRSAYVPEVTPGTIPATPVFTATPAPMMLMATPQILEGRPLIAKGARLGRGIAALDVTGSISDADMIYGAYDDLFATLLQNAWATDVLRDGKAVRSVAVENTIKAGDGGVDTYLRFRGVEATAATLNLQARQKANLSMTLVGRGSDDSSTTAIVGATYADPDEFDPISSGSDVGTIVMDGYTLDCMEALEINFAFEKRDLQPRIGDDDLCGISRGDFVPVLTANIYVEANFAAIYNAARDRETPSFGVTIPFSAGTGLGYSIEFPSCKFGTAELDMSGTNLMQRVQILPQYDLTEECVVIITRGM